MSLRRLAQPLVDIANTTRTIAVIANGLLVDSSERQKILENEQALRRNLR